MRSACRARGPAIPLATRGTHERSECETKGLAQERERRLETCREHDDPAADPIGSLRRRDASEHDGRDDPPREPARTGKHVRTATRQPNETEALDSELVGELLDVAREIDDGRVEVTCRSPGPGPLDGDHAHIPPCRRTAHGVRDLAAGARRAVEPEHHAPVGHAVLRVREAPPVAQLDVVFAGRTDRAFHLDRYDQNSSK